MQKRLFLIGTFAIGAGLGVGAATSASPSGGAQGAPVRGGPSYDAAVAGADRVRVHVELGGDAALALAVEPGVGLRLSGGTPGHVGAIRLGADASARSAVVPGVFDARGALVIALPAGHGEVFVQGVERTPAGVARSEVHRLLPGGTLGAPRQELARSLGGLERPTRVRFDGTVRLAGHVRTVDAELLTGRAADGDGFVLTLPDVIARTVDARGAQTLRARTADALAGAVESALTLAAFSGVEHDLARAQSRLAALRAGLAGAPGDGGSVVVEPATELSAGAEVLETLDPGRPAGEKQPLLERRESGVRPSAGEPGDAAGTSVILVEASLGDVTPLDPGQPAGEKQPLLELRGSGARPSAGEPGDAGGTSVVLVEASLGDVTPLDPGQPAGEKQPLLERRESGARPSAGEPGDAGGTSVVLPEASVGRATPIDPGDPVQPAGDGRALFGRRETEVARPSSAPDGVAAVADAFLAALREVRSLEAVVRSLELARERLGTR